jgi:hypothetical protein
MAEERTLGLARVQEQTAGEPSKEELQRRLEDARDSISNTVTEIKETVAHQVQAVKDTLDWREQFKKRPLLWCLGATGVGFSLGYCIANYAKGDDESERHYASQAATGTTQPGNGSHDSGPGFFQRVANSHAFERVKDEASDVGDALVQEISKTAKTVVLPALMVSLRNFIGDHLPNAEKGQQSQQPQSSYQPALERNPS